MMDDGLTMIDILKPVDVEVKIRGDGKVLCECKRHLPFTH